MVRFRPNLKTPVPGLLDAFEGRLLPRPLFSFLLRGEGRLVHPTGGVLAQFFPMLQYGIDDGGDALVRFGGPQPGVVDFSLATPRGEVRVLFGGHHRLLD